MTRRIQSISVTLVLAALLLTPLDAALAQDDAGRVKVQMTPQRAMSGYLKIGDIKGESKDEGHKDWIDILSVDWDEGSSAAARQVVVTRTLDKASPKIVEAIADGANFRAVSLDAPDDRADAGQQTYLRYELENARVTSYSIDASGDIPTETITLNFEKISQKSGVLLKGKKILEN